MAPRANWKGFLRLSLVTCPVALYPATSESEKVSLQPDQPQDRPPHQIRQGRRRHRRGSRQRRHHEGLQGRHRHLHRGDEGRAREHRAGIDPHHRDRRVRAASRYRQPLSDPPLLSRAGRQGRPRRLRGDPRNHPQHEQGRDRPRGADQPRAHHRAGAARQGTDGNAAALPLRGARARRNISTISRT